MPAPQIKYAENDSTILKPRLRLGHVPQLDGLRAIAISFVIVAHSVNPELHPVVSQFGYLGVLIFFSLSGYLITKGLLEEFQKTNRISLRSFYIRRFFRILPPAFLYLGVVWVLSEVNVLHCDWASIRAALFLYANYIEDWRSGWMIGHFWSLSVEEHFYCIWPAVLIVAGVRRGWATAAALAILVCFLRIADNRVHFLGQIFNNPSLAHYHSDLVCDTLLWGCALAFFARPNQSDRNAFFTVLAVVALALLVASVIFSVDHFTPLAHALPTLLLGSILAAPNGPLGLMLKLPLLRFVGRISYSMYLWQTLFLGLFNWAAAISLILICALFSYRFVEQPFIRLGHRYANPQFVGPKVSET